MDLFTYSPLKASYDTVYDALSNMRELFHQTGRFDDSNAKLDEVAKLFATYLAFRKGLIPAFPLHPSDSDLIAQLQESFENAASIPDYSNDDSSSLFGRNPSLSLRPGEEELARSLIALVTASVDTAITNKELDRPFDVLNEAFGHFIRDNFRSNTEDAQYLTPPEVVEFMVSLATAHLEAYPLPGSSAHPFLVLDPCCGVASFLAAFYHQARRHPALRDRAIALHGQDKVERMTRLSRVNLTLFDAASQSVTLGNSLEKGSPIDALAGQADLVLTNPPFGARFPRHLVARAGGDLYPLLDSPSLESSTIDSELLFIDRSLALLKDGGLLLIVVPDSVVSARGTPAFLRRQLMDSASVRAVIGLPTVAFAQAGTRTRTCILFLQKSPADGRPVFVAESESLGFEVTSRKGASVKLATGPNDLLHVLAAYQESRAMPNEHHPIILTESPSSVLVPCNRFLRSAWTPAHYHASRLNAVHSVNSSTVTTPTPLGDLVAFLNSDRRPQRHKPGTLFISVRHIIGEGIIDMAALNEYSPKTPGLPAMPGEILLSKINPRIPRVLVVPDLNAPILCSSEFEVMAAKPGVAPHMIAYLLLQEEAQSQLQSLTSGTSASHNRIKSADLSRIVLPWPEPGTDYGRSLRSLMADYAATLDRITSDTRHLIELRALETAAKLEAHLSAQEPA